MKNVVVIPVYKEQPSGEELRSLRQCIRILGKHDICLFGPADLNLSLYDSEFKKEGVTYSVEHFDSHYFKSQRGYNKLMLTRAFYERFRHWDYMLIYQLDAFVFSDQLDEWCIKGYDYIGAPFLKLNKEVDSVNSGNGGFSLRRIQSFINAFDITGKVLHAKGLRMLYRNRGPLRRHPLTILGMFGYSNHLENFLSKEELNEDLFYSMLGDSSLKWNVATTPVAMFFAFEGRPSFLFSLTRQLPFGCHAYLKNEYETFYKPYIERKESTGHD